MNSTKNRKLKVITFVAGGNTYTTQIASWKITNGTDDGERFYVYIGPNTPDSDGEFREDAEDDYSIDIKFFSDWTVNGLSDFLVQNNKATVAFTLDNHPDIPGEYVRWSGFVKVKAATAGGDVRTTEQQEITLPIIGKPTFSRP